MRTVRSTKMPGIQVLHNSASSALINFQGGPSRSLQVASWVAIPLAVLLFLAVSGFFLGILP